jgi:hypothetical protein
MPDAVPDATKWSVRLLVIDLPADTFDFFPADHAD